mmetsp:Transcript_713/g.1122  ORF Transcript_713/g.1122 Transcript_713/m.1122 type:complete len:93 (-) Transcript_713:211-489(-)
MTNHSGLSISCRRDLYSKDNNAILDTQIYCIAVSTRNHHFGTDKIVILKYIFNFLDCYSYKTNNENYPLHQTNRNKSNPPSESDIFFAPSTT